MVLYEVHSRTSNLSRSSVTLSRRNQYRMPPANWSILVKLVEAFKKQTDQSRRAETSVWRPVARIRRPPGTSTELRGKPEVPEPWLLPFHHHVSLGTLQLSSTTSFPLMASKPALLKRLIRYRQPWRLSIPLVERCSQGA